MIKPLLEQHGLTAPFHIQWDAPPIFDYTTEPLEIDLEAFQKEMDRMINGGHRLLALPKALVTLPGDIHTTEFNPDDPTKPDEPIIR